MRNIEIDRRTFMAGAAATSCLISKSALAQQRANMRIITPFGYVAGFSEMLYADTGGFFAKNGLNVEIDGGRGGGMAIQQVISGNVLLCRAGPTDFIKAYAKDPSIVAIAESVRGDMFYVISHVDRPLRTPADFAGKTIGVPTIGTSAHNILEMMMFGAGVPTDSTQVQAIGSTPGNFELVKQGRIAGFIADSDVLIRLNMDKQPIEAWSTDKLAPCPGQVFMTLRTTFDKDVENLSRFLRAVYECMGVLLENVDKLEPMITSMTSKYEIAEFKGSDKGMRLLHNIVEHNYTMSHKSKLESSVDHWNTAYDLMVKAKIVPPLNKRDFYDDRARKLALG